MSKQNVDNLIDHAYKLLAELGVAEEGKINSTFRGQIASFGSAVAMGSLLSAVAFFSQQANSSVDRPKLMSILCAMVINKTNSDEVNLFEYVKHHNDLTTRELILDCAVAVKLAMNLYTLERGAKK